MSLREMCRFLCLLGKGEAWGDSGVGCGFVCDRRDAEWCLDVVGVSGVSHRELRVG